MILNSSHEVYEKLYFGLIPWFLVTNPYLHHLWQGDDGFQGVWLPSKMTIIYEQHDTFGICGFAPIMA
jgi:hypothetical protein